MRELWDWLPSVVVVLLYLTVVYLWVGVRHEAKVDQLVVLFAGLAFFIAVLAITPTRRRRRLEDAQLESAAHLARIAELLEQNEPVVLTQPATKRR